MELVIGLAIAGIVTVVTLNLAKETTNLQVKSANETDLIQLKSEILSTLSTYNHCNANFFSKPVGVNLPILAATNGLYKCNTPGNDCILTGTPQIRFPAQSASWDQSISKISNRLRINDIKYTLQAGSTNCEQQSLLLTINAQSKDYNNKIKDIVINSTIAVTTENGAVKECLTLDRVGSATCVSLATAGQAAYTTPGTYSWTVPAGVTSVSVVAVGAGGSMQGPLNGASGGGGGGALAYKNNISVTPGSNYTIVVGGTSWNTAGGNTTAFGVTAGGGQVGSGGIGGNGGTYSGADGGGNGGSGGSTGATGVAGGGGAGGYAGNGGAGGSSSSGSNGATNSGAGGGGGFQAGAAITAWGGGGVGLFGIGTTGAGGALGGSGGSGGSGVVGYGGGNYGGGGTGWNGGGSGNGGSAAVRIIWPGTTRQFPSTRTADE